jgi:hypothetical protein
MKSGVSAYAAGVGLRRSTARTWSAVSHAVPLSQNVRTRGRRGARGRFRGKLRLSCGRARESASASAAAFGSSNSPLCRFVESFGLCVVRVRVGSRWIERESRGRGTAWRRVEGWRHTQNCSGRVCACKLACRLIRPSSPDHCNSLDSR